MGFLILIGNMTHQQFKNWYRFAIRMAWRGFKRIPKKSKKKIAYMVKDFFRILVSNWTKEAISRIIDWDSSEECDKCKKANEEKDYYKTHNCRCQIYICDEVSRMEEYWNPYYWQDLDSQSDHTPYAKWRDRWTDKVSCCLRAGLDLASSSSAGVVGFEVCDLKRMYKGNIPNWINNKEWLDENNQKVDLNQGDCHKGIWL